MTAPHVLAIIPESLVDEDAAVPAGCTLVPWLGPDDIVRALFSDFDAAVLMSDGLGESGVHAVLQAVQECGKPVVEVRGEQWDGFAPMPLAAVCKGVVTGFGVEGAWAAAEALRA
jgi:hypothetical protein